MIQRVARLTIVACLSLLLQAQDKPASLNRLPVKRVVLFKNGVGYFEHIGSVRGNESVSVSFTSGQLNDVLKSLTVLDLNGGHIAGVAYGTATPIDRQFGDLRLSLGDKSTIPELLDALRGIRVEVRNGGSLISGRLLGVERKNRVSSGVSQEVDYLSLISEAGELKTTELSSSSSVRLLEPGLTGQLNRYLNLISDERKTNARNMVIYDEGVGNRNLYVSYISEVPVWKSTYRLVLNSKAGKTPLLQGWAIVDNVVGEDWNNVELSLVAGAPQSFIQNLSQPYYAQRPVVGIPNTVSTTPQTYESTLTPGSAQLSGVVTDPSGGAVSGAIVKVLNASETVIAQATSNAKGAYEIASLPEGPIHLQILAPGFASADIQGLTVTAGNPIQQNAQLQIGSVAQTVEVTPQSPVADTNGRLGRGTSLGRAKGGVVGGVVGGVGVGSGNGFGGGEYRVGLDRSRFDAAAVSQALGDLFEYRLKEPITILKNRSALVPIAQAPISVEKVSVWNDRSVVPRPQRAVWITNTTGLTLDGGSVSVLEDDTFTGEGIFDPIRPGEKRLLSFATDLAVNASSHTGSETQRVSRVVINKGIMTQEIEDREKKTYTFRNDDATPRIVVVEHPARSGYELKSEAKPAETTADWLRFRVEVAPKQTASLVVEEARPIKSQFMLTSISSDQVAYLVSQHSIDLTIQSGLQEVLSQKDAVAALQLQKSARAEETQKIFDDQQRLRENIKALRGTPEEKPLLQRYTGQLNDQENRLAALQTETAQLDNQINAANGKLNDTIQKLAFDVRF